jgi:hypothetical protein
MPINVKGKREAKVTAEQVFLIAIARLSLRRNPHKKNNVTYDQRILFSPTPNPSSRTMSPSHAKCCGAVRRFFIITPLRGEKNGKHVTDKHCIWEMEAVKTVDYPIQDLLDDSLSFYRLDAQILYFNTFIFLYMFRALMCSSSGGQTCISTASGIVSLFV